MRVSEEKPAMTLSRMQQNMCCAATSRGREGWRCACVCACVCGGADNGKAVMVRMMLL